MTRVRQIACVSSIDIRRYPEETPEKGASDGQRVRSAEKNRNAGIEVTHGAYFLVDCLGSVQLWSKTIHLMWIRTL